METNITLAESIALSKAKQTKKKLEAGSYKVDGVFHVSAEFVKAEDYEKTPTATIPVKKALALVLQNSGITRANSIAILEKSIREALDGNKKVDISLVEGAMERITDMLEALPKKKVSGPTTFQKIEVVRIK